MPFFQAIRPKDVTPKTDPSVATTTSLTADSRVGVGLFLNRKISVLPSLYRARSPVRRPSQRLPSGAIASLRAAGISGSRNSRLTTNLLIFNKAREGPMVSAQIL